jgi:hypothetical protein
MKTIENEKFLVFCFSFLNKMCFFMTTVDLKRFLKYSTPNWSYQVFSFLLIFCSCFEKYEQMRFDSNVSNDSEPNDLIIFCEFWILAFSVIFWKMSVNMSAENMSKMVIFSYSFFKAHSTIKYLGGIFSITLFTFRQNAYEQS